MATNCVEEVGDIGTLERPLIYSFWVTPAAQIVNIGTLCEQVVWRPMFKNVLFCPVVVDTFPLFGACFDGFLREVVLWEALFVLVLVVGLW